MIARFVAGTAAYCRLIIAQEKTTMPLTPSHVEALSRDGKSYIGSHLGGGMQARPVGYDAGQFSSELLLDLQATTEEDDAFYAALDKMMGEPYDWTAILGFIVPERFHEAGHVICSAAFTLALRSSGWLPHPVAVPAHLITPAGLLFGISCVMEVPGI